MVLSVKLLPEVTKTWSATLLPLSVCEHEKICACMLRVFAAKSARGEAPSDLWLTLVRKEISWSSKNHQYLTWRHRSQVCELLSLLASWSGDIPAGWSLIVPESRQGYLASRAALDWASANVDKLSPRRRDEFIDLLEDFCAENPDEFRPQWSILYT